MAGADFTHRPAKSQQDPVPALAGQGATAAWALLGGAWARS
jgi:hypothetical protein